MCLFKAAGAEKTAPQLKRKRKLLPLRVAPEAAGPVTAAESQGRAHRVDSLPFFWIDIPVEAGRK